MSIENFFSALSAFWVVFRTLKCLSFLTDFASVPSIAKPPSSNSFCFTASFFVLTEPKRDFCAGDTSFSVSSSLGRDLEFLIERTGLEIFPTSSLVSAKSRSALLRLKEDVIIRALIRVAFCRDFSEENCYSTMFFGLKYLTGEQEELSSLESGSMLKNSSIAVFSSFFSLAESLYGSLGMFADWATSLTGSLSES